MNAPLSHKIAAILVVLEDGPLHGYAIRKQAEELSRKRIPYGTLYRYIDELEMEDLIEKAQSPLPRELDDERRKYFKISKKGRALLNEHIDYLRRFDRSPALVV